MLKDLLQRGKCGLGFHTGDWVYVAAGACQQEQVCPRCDARSQQVVHEWQEWAAPNPAACDLVRRCARCGDEQMKTEHVWAAPAYAAAGSCAQVRLCSRCTTEEAAETAHVWDGWSYRNDDVCDQVLSCSRCGQQGSAKRVAHDWGAWRTSAFYAARVCVCRHCAEMVLNLDEHDELEGAVSFQATHRALWGVIQTSDVASVRDRIEADRGLLLGPAVRRCLQFSIDELVHDDDTRTTLRELGVLLERCQVDGIDAVFADSPTVQTSAITVEVEQPSPELTGHWRHTEVLGSGFTMTTDTHMVLGRNGRFRWWSHSATAKGENISDAEFGSWSCSNHVLALSWDDGTEHAFRYARTGEQMLLESGSGSAYWERI